MRTSQRPVRSPAGFFGASGFQGGLDADRISKIRSPTILSSPGAIMYAVIEMPVSFEARAPPRPPSPPPARAILGSVVYRMFETSSPVMPSLAGSQLMERPGLLL